MALPEGVEAPAYNESEGKSEEEHKDGDKTKDTQGIFEFFEKDESDYDSNDDYGNTRLDHYDSDYDDSDETSSLYNTRRTDDIYQ